MCKKILFAFLLMTTAVVANSQLTISGKVTGSKNEPLAGASISIKDSYDGATASVDGSFSFMASDTGRKILQVTMTGFAPFEKEMVVIANIYINVSLKEAITDLTAVMIT